MDVNDVRTRVPQPLMQALGATKAHGALGLIAGALRWNREPVHGYPAMSVGSFGPSGRIGRSD